MNAPMYLCIESSRYIVSDSIGFKKPPRHTQFRPGESGNPGGRPKKKPTVADDLALELAEIVSIDEGQLKITKQRALLRSLLAAALAGDPRAAKLVLDLARTSAVDDADAGLEADEDLLKD